MALLLSLGLSTRASDHGLTDPAGMPFASRLPSAGDSQALLHASVPTTLEGGMGATAPLSPSYTVHLPLIHAGHWQAPDSLLGVQIYDSDPDAENKVAHMGARWARLPLKWGSIEPENTDPISYYWSVSFDNWLARLASKNIQVILTLTKNPSWAATYPGGPIDQPGASNSDLVEFMVAAVGRYSQPPYNVKHWEFYNEPDNGDEFYAELGWGYFGNDPEAYAQLLAAVYQPIKAADPEAQIVFGGIAYDWWTTDGGPFVEDFLDGVLAYDGGDSFDVMNFHYYPAFRINWELYGPDILGKAAYIRTVLATYDVDKPLICTEASQWSDEAHGGSDELQSRYVAQVFARSMAADLEITIWFMLIDSGGLGNWEYGLLNPDRSPKPSYFAYSTFARQMAFAQYVRMVPPGEMGSYQVEAYEFLTQRGGTKIIVAWAIDDQGHNTWWTADQMAVVDKFGVRTMVYDEDDGQLDGQVRVTIGPSPLYLRVAP
jgi:hypothetical protein